MMTAPTIDGKPFDALHVRLNLDVKHAPMIVQHDDRGAYCGQFYDGATPRLVFNAIWFNKQA